MLSFRVFIALRQTEIDDVYIVLGVLTSADEEVVGFNITVDNPLFVNLLNALDLSAQAIIKTFKLVAQ